ncbi:NADH:ubiquinone reductase (Na(+)-transporting) subunit B [Neolewinella lacunae]|uniref:Na(+)-translocating NADH-quinone reductase subunit B n=1 Tax=Neolewinella lacunae TaxID=1517758 RepID=A0A923PN19_9BACT|nr:NADH:ubiquinone reductase (Na(+)-transporting) subunit B [Neolewinella lacunae]MBC6995721.1 NADH:ubiquinone reductase (Na(+)-transporting) subunit B [Neolewinella lacunae]MDN3636586.1 NADH:ubiquinone reductase (Na(+)-transporting) subunit B [Neolewinella lacunae]
MKALHDFVKKFEPDHNNKLAHTTYDAFYTFLFQPPTVTKGGVHIKDGMDLKRLMVHVVLALQLLYVFGTWNIGHQHFVAIGEHTGLLEGFLLKVVYGLIQVLPIFVVTHVVGLGIEFFYAARKGHSVEEGFLVSGALIPLIMPPDIPLVWLAVAIAFAVVLGKEAFGGTGMNIWNVALLARVFIFFAYPTTISGDEVWISGIEKVGTEYFAASYGWAHHAFDWIFSGLGLATFGEGGQAVVDGFTGATPLGIAAKEGWAGVEAVYTEGQIFWGTIPGSIGETSVPLIVIGMIFLMVTRIADYRVIVGGLIGFFVAALMMNAIAPADLGPDTPGVFKFMAIHPLRQLMMGSFLFAITFMATDPVSSADTPTGKWIYGFLIAFIGLIIRVMNPAYPEGWMLSILLMNTFAPLIDHYVYQANAKRRAKRTSAMAKQRDELITRRGDIKVFNGDSDYRPVGNAGTYQ